MRRTRMHGGQSGYQTMSSTEQRLQLIHLQVRAKGVDSLSDRDRILWDSDKVKRKERKKPVQREQSEAMNLDVLAAIAWWYPGFSVEEARTHDPKRARDLKRVGVKRGKPDCSLVIPNRFGWHVHAYCELKEESHRPAREPSGWWLDHAWTIAFVPKMVKGKPDVVGVWRYTEGDGREQDRRHGLHAEQAFWLRNYHGAGCETFVAYSGKEAFDWFDEMAGPKPDVLPEGW